MKKTALLIDVTSIQKFVFASNKLKENLGASFLISDLYDSLVSNNPTIKDLPLKESDGKYDGYIGGGNALFFFNNEDNAKIFVKEYTKSLLVLAPGVVVATAIGEMDDDRFKDTRDTLFKQLAINKQKYIPQTITQRHGISAECQSDGYSMDVWSDSEELYISAATNAKVNAFPDSRKRTNEDFEEQLGKEFYFTDLLDELGQSKGSENHIAIVHIDGNSMGIRFKELDSLEATRKLSKELENAVKVSFKQLLVKITNEIKSGKLKDYLNIKENKPIPLPIRPIILGGDDITFVCDGRMGIYYAKIFMEAFSEQPVSYGEPLSSCAGIAVIKTNYPFYKGYQLAEELCANAKSRWREKGEEGSWFDFHIAYGGFSGSLNEIRESHYKAPLGSLIFRPYRINDNGEFGLDTMIKNLIKLKEKDKNGKPRYPNNKLKELRNILTLGQNAASTFISEMDARGLAMPDVCNKGYNKSLFVNERTPYLDMLELLEYYPKYELEGIKNEKK